ncbi:MAG: GNAT family N-acetyltransferase [Bacteroidetes bacterium]|nr:GNAT family N-acetyltransferase [Bacteroidota bacterium]
MNNNQDIRLEKFSKTDFDTLLSWIKDEKELIQFAGPIFSFPLTKEQLSNYVADSKRNAFKIIHNDTNRVIGHCEAYKTDKQNSRLCRILIGDKNFRGKGYGTILAKLLTEWSFDNLHTNFVDLNVYDFNASAIKSYENVGFKKIAINEMTTQVNSENWTSYKMIVTREDFYEKTRQKTTNS